MKIGLGAIYPNGDVPYPQQNKRRRLENKLLTDLGCDIIMNICLHSSPESVGSLMRVSKVFSEQAREIYSSILIQSALLTDCKKLEKDTAIALFQEVTCAIENRLEEVGEYFDINTGRNDWKDLSLIVLPILSQLPDTVIGLSLSQKWLEAFPSLLFWNKLNCHISFPWDQSACDCDTFNEMHEEEKRDTIGLSQLNTPEKQIAKAAEFKGWLEEHAATISEWTLMDLNWYPMWEMPKEIFQLTQLTNIEMQSTPLTRLSPDIAKLPNLVALNFHNSRLSSLPTTIGQLTLLENLCVGENRLTALPTEISQLISLTNLELYGNVCEEEPEGIALLTNLTALNGENYG